MGSIELTVEDGGAEVQLRRSARARRMSLRVSSVDGRVTLTLPKRAPLRQARAFLSDHRDWIAKALGAVAPPVVVAPGVCLPVEGGPRPLVAADVRLPRIEDATLLVPARNTGARVEVFLKELARARFADAVEGFGQALSVQPGRITLRDTRSRWGSCSSRGDLMFSWRLIMAPPEVLRYVAAHEVAHLVHMNHSADFWALTARLDPDHLAARAWLKRDGHDLHRYRFRGTAAPC